MTDERETDMSQQTTIDERRELDRRTADGIEIRLLWNPGSDTVSIAVWDHRDDEGFDLEVERDQALHAFHHPYAYAALRRYSERPSALAA
jgi:hypothetical protein